MATCGQKMVRVGGLMFPNGVAFRLLNIQTSPQPPRFQSFGTCNNNDNEYKCLGEMQFIYMKGYT